jgi:hypothetical protein
MIDQSPCFFSKTDMRVLYQESLDITVARGMPHIVVHGFIKIST